MKLAAVLFVVGALLISGCTEDASRQLPSDITLERIYDRMERALVSNDSELAHVTIAIEQLSKQRPELFFEYGFVSRSEELWIDTTNEVARAETRTRKDEDSTDRIWRIIRHAEGAYSVEDDGRSFEFNRVTCTGSDSAMIGELLDCATSAKESIVLERADYHGEDVIAIRFKGVRTSDGVQFPHRRRLLVDPSSFLPIASEEQTTMTESGRADRTYRLVRTYTFDFVERSSLPNSFFEPEAIGYEQYDPSQNLRAQADGMRVYWLGRTHAAPDGNTLNLLSAYSPTFPPPPGYGAMLSYEEVGGARNHPVITLQEFSHEAWAVATDPDTVAHVWNGENVTREEILLPGGRALLFPIQGGQEFYLAHVYLATTVIVVTDGGGPSPFRSREIFIDIIKSLRPYE